MHRTSPRQVNQHHRTWLQHTSGQLNVDQSSKFSPHARSHTARIGSPVPSWIESRYSARKHLERRCYGDLIWWWYGGQ